MVVSERTRHQLYKRLEETLGAEPATTLMEHLPPVGWADVATKRDLEHLAMLVGARFDAVDYRFDSLEARMDQIGPRMDRLGARMDRLEARMDRLEARMEGAEARMGRLEATLHRELRAQTWKLIGTFLTFGSLLVAALKF